MRHLAPGKIHILPAASGMRQVFPKSISVHLCYLLYYHGIYLDMPISFHWVYQRSKQVAWVGHWTSDSSTRWNQSHPSRDSTSSTGFTHTFRTLSHIPVVFHQILLMRWRNKWAAVRLICKIFSSFQGRRKNKYQHLIKLVVPHVLFSLLDVVVNTQKTHIKQNKKLMELVRWFCRVGGEKVSEGFRSALVWWKTQL